MHTNAHMHTETPNHQIRATISMKVYMFSLPCLQAKTCLAVSNIKLEDGNIKLPRNFQDIHGLAEDLDMV